MREREFVFRVRDHTPNFCAKEELWDGKLGEKNGTLPCSKPKILVVERLTLNMNSYTLNTQTHCMCITVR